MNNNTCDLSMINGNSIDIAPQGCDSEIKADIVVSEFNSVRLWGQVVNCTGEPVANALLKLVKVVYDCAGKCVYQGIAHTVSDCNGFYQFDLCVDDPCAKYKVLVNKSAVGTERIIDTGTGNCNACTQPDYTPCGDYKYRVTPPDQISCPKNYNDCGCNKVVAEPYQECKCKAADPFQECKCNSSHIGGNVYAATKVRF